MEVIEWAEQAVRNFGAGVGLTGLSLLDPDGIHLETDNGAIEIRFIADAKPPVVLVVRSEPIPYKRHATLRNALKAADLRTHALAPVHVATDEDQLIYAIRIDAREMTHALLETTLDELDRLHQRASDSGIAR